MSYLNSINYGGANQWRLPTVLGYAEIGGYFGNRNQSELNELFYIELGGSQGYAVPDTVFFENEQASLFLSYWLGTEYASNPDRAWGFFSHSGYPYPEFKSTKFSVWAVSPGQIAAVPLPAASWLMGVGLLGLIAGRAQSNCSLNPVTRRPATPPAPRPDVWPRHSRQVLVAALPLALVPISISNRRTPCRLLSSRRSLGILRMF